MKSSDMDNTGKQWGVGSGVVGGMTHYLIQMQGDSTFLESLIKAAITAFVCGVVGAAGKWAFDWVKRKLTKNKA